MKCAHRFLCEFLKKDFNYKECENMDPCVSPFSQGCHYFTAELEKGGWKPVMVQVEGGLRKQPKCLSCGHILDLDYDYVVNSGFWLFCPCCGAAKKDLMRIYYCNTFVEKDRKEMEKEAENG